MKNPETDRESTGAEREIARRFARLRAAEAASAPVFTRQAGPLVASSAWLRFAAAVAAIAVTVTLLRQAPEEDPAALYAGIMAHRQVQTDALLTVSDSVLPALSAVPSLYDMESALATEEGTH